MPAYSSSSSTYSRSRTSLHSISRKISGLLCIRQPSHESSDFQQDQWPPSASQDTLDLERYPQGAYHVDTRPNLGGKGTPTRQSSAYSEGSSSSGTSNGSNYAGVGPRGHCTSGEVDGRVSSPAKTRASDNKNEMIVGRKILPPFPPLDDFTPNTHPAAPKRPKVDTSFAYLCPPRQSEEHPITPLAPPPEHRRRRRSFLDTHDTSFGQRK